jgi:EAL and modified HD-GYP domain-containing signal transduction protein
MPLGLARPRIPASTERRASTRARFTMPFQSISEQPSTEGKRAGTPESLTAFDWLHTIVDEMLVAGDKAAARLAAPTAPQPFPPTLPAIFEIADRVPPVASRVLGQVLLGYCPMVDCQGGVIATRLTVVPTSAEISIDAAALLREVRGVWPEGGEAVSLDVASDVLLADLLRADPARNVMIEVAASVAADSRNTIALLELAARGNTLLLRGRPTRELPREVLPCFRWSIIDLDEDRRFGSSSDAGARPGRRMPYVQAGVRTMAQFRRSTELGAIAVLGWPLDDEAVGQRTARLDAQVIVELINRIDRREPAEALEQTLVRDPGLAFELIRHANEREEGLRLEAASFRHAIMILGHQEIRRWLALLLSSHGHDHVLHPTHYAALRRGLFMRELASEAGDEQLRSELFMCGVFSLLDRLFGKPVEELMSALVVPERVRQALVERTGPCMPMLQMARSVESGSPHEIRAAAQALFMKPIEANHALLRALATARQLSG